MGGASGSSVPRAACTTGTSAAASYLAMGSSVGPSPRAVVAVVGATGRQGSAVCRHLIQDRWRVRALTRNPSSAAAHALAEQGAQIQRADSEDIGSLRRAFHGVHGVFNALGPRTYGGIRRK